MPASDWRIEPDANNAVAAAVLAQDPAWTGYALADLDPPFRRYARVALARRGREPWSAGFLVLRHPEFTATIPYGDPDGLAALLAAAQLPEHTSLSVLSEHREVLSRHFTFETTPRTMRRLWVSEESFAPPGGDLPAVGRLELADLAALQDLYAAYDDRWFYPDQLETGVFYGVRTAADLAAAGGTQAVSRRYHVAAIGNIYTRPAARGHGYATAVTAAVAEALLRQGCRVIILNVLSTNDAAIRVYERLEFQERCRFWEVAATRRVAQQHERC